MRATKWLIIPFVLVVAAVAVLAVRNWFSVPTVDAQAVIANACADAEFQSAHMVLHGTDSLDGEVISRFRWELKTDGKSLYRYLKNLDSLHETEFYIVGGKMYSRGTGDRGTWGAWSVRDFVIPDSEPTGPVGRVDDAAQPDTGFCGLGDLTDHRYLGEVQLNGAKVKHFSAKVDDQGSDTALELWVNDLGRVSQYAVTETTPDRVVAEVEATITYPTQPFTITAPTVP